MNDFLKHLCLTPQFLGFLLLIASVLTSCGGSSKSKIEQIKAQSKVADASPKTLAEAEANWKSYEGVGPIAPFQLPETIDQQLVESGQLVYETNCTACHKTDTRFIGPAPKGILNRRQPAWIMNMILNPTEMVEKDPLAKLLFMEYNASPMANQNLSQEEARAILEYFRTL